RGCGLGCAVAHGGILRGIYLPRLPPEAVRGADRKRACRGARAGRVLRRVAWVSGAPERDRHHDVRRPVRRARCVAAEPQAGDDSARVDGYLRRDFREAGLTRRAGGLLLRRRETLLQLLEEIQRDIEPGDLVLARSLLDRE